MGAFIGLQLNHYYRQVGITARPASAGMDSQAAEKWQ